MDQDLNVLGAAQTKNKKTVHTLRGAISIKKKKQCMVTYDKEVKMNNEKVLVSIPSSGLSTDGLSRVNFL